MFVPVFSPNRAKPIEAAEAPHVCTGGKQRGLAGARRPGSARQACAISTMIFGAALIVWPQAGLAQSSNTIGTGSVVRPLASLPLRDAPPEGLLGAKGDIV